MKNAFFLVFLFGIFNLNAQIYKPLTETASVKNTIQQQHKDTKSITADFTEKTASTMLKEPEIGSGTFEFKKENKVRWDNTSAKQLILINGDKVKMYENGKLNTNPANQKVVKQIQGMMLSMLSGDFLNEKDFTITYFEATKHYKLVLKPKNPRLSKYIQKIELLFNKRTNLLDEMAMIESAQQSIVYTFSNQKINQHIADSKFTQL